MTCFSKLKVVKLSSSSELKKSRYTTFSEQQECGTVDGQKVNDYHININVKENSHGKKLKI
jgi:hypothetical protein